MYLSTVLNKIRTIGQNGEPASFDITYRKADETFGSKTNVRRRAGEDEDELRKQSAARVKNKKAGQLHLVDSVGRRFNIHIPLLVTFNGQIIDHRF